MNSWNLKSLVEWVELQKIDNEPDLERISSIDRAVDIFGYHFYQAKTDNDLIRPESIKESFELILPLEEKKEELWRRKLAIQANTQACLHSARAIHDLLAQLINGLVLPDKVAIPINDCNIIKVESKLEPSELKVHLTGLLNSIEFKYVNAFVNTIKHRNLVAFGALMPNGINANGMYFRAFKFKQQSFDRLLVEDVLKLALQVKNAVATAGTLLNKELGISGV